MATRASPFSAMLDACVLYPAPLRDLLVQIASSGLYRAKWTNEIHEEWMRSVLANRKDLSRAQLERTRDLMNKAVLDCVVTNYQPLIAAVALPDKDDRHILAAAIHARCDAIVTFNLKDFPESALKPHNIEAIHPDDFLFHQIGLNQALVIASAHLIRRRLNNPPVTAREYLDTLLAQSLPKTVNELMQFVTVI